VPELRLEFAAANESMTKLGKQLRARVHRGHSPFARSGKQVVRHAPPKQR